MTKNQIEVNIIINKYFQKECYYWTNQAKYIKIMYVKFKFMEKNMFKIYLENEEKTKEIGYKLGKLLNENSVICLIGDLGAGKTTLTQNIAKALEVDDYITSPTFTIVNEYEGKYPLYHFDVYRIGSSDEMYDIGYDEYVDGEGVCIIEWANLIEDILPKEYLYITLKYVDNSREMILNPIGEKYEKIVQNLLENI